MKKPKQLPPLELARELRALGLSVGYASDIANGKRTPGGKLAARIEASLGIPASSWFQEQIRQAG